MKYGYERGKGAKDLNPQSELLSSMFRVDRIFTDPHLQGLEDWSYLYKLIEHMEAGSILYTESIYRVSNNLDELFKLIEILDNKGIRFVAAYQSIETVTVFGRSILKILRGAIDIIGILENKEAPQNTIAVKKLENGLNQIRNLYKDKNRLLGKK